MSPVRLLRLEFRDLRASGRNQLLVGVRVARETPTPVGCLGQQDPRAVGERGIPGRIGDSAIVMMVQCVSAPV